MNLRVGPGLSSLYHSLFIFGDKRIQIFPPCWWLRLRGYFWQPNFFQLCLYLKKSNTFRPVRLIRRQFTKGLKRLTWNKVCVGHNGWRNRQTIHWSRFHQYCPLTYRELLVYLSPTSSKISKVWLWQSLYAEVARYQQSYTWHETRLWFTFIKFYSSSVEFLWERGKQNGPDLTL